MPVERELALARDATAMPVLDLVPQPQRVPVERAGTRTGVFGKRCSSSTVASRRKAAQVRVRSPRPDRS